MNDKEDDLEQDFKGITILESYEDCNDKLSQDPEMKEEIRKIIEAESTNFQWSKLALHYGMLALMVILGILRGPGVKPSLIGVERCQPLDYIFLLTLLICAIIFTRIGTQIMKSDYEKKEEVGYPFV